ncbi:MMPL family transporter [Amycolatopsis sp. DSM 110486]|nr:MMPL family transporter [Amycolatopsis sp. DSM 110486]
MLPTDSSRTGAPSPSQQQRRETLAERISAWSVQHRAPAIIGWLALVALALLISAVAPGEGARAVDPGESGRAEVALDAQGKHEPVRENVLVQPESDGRAPFSANPAVRAATGDLVATLRAVPGAVAEVLSPLDDSSRISGDGRSGLVTFVLAGPDDQVSAHYRAATEAVGQVAARHPQARLAQAGDVSLNDVVNDSLGHDVERAGLISLVLTLAILLIVFGALVAAVLPVLLAMTAVAGAFGLLGVIDKAVPVNSAVNAIVLLIGMAVGVDYTLFSLRRVREERAAGHTDDEALRITARTSGRVIVVSGVTVILCLSAMLFTGLDNLRGAGLGTAVVVAAAMAGAVTFLPALISLLGPRIDRGRLPWIGRRRTAAAESRAWSVVVRTVVRRPLAWGGAAALVLIIAALPASDMRLEDAGALHSVPRSVPAMDAAIRVNEAFPGVIAPAKIVVWDDDGGVVDKAGVAQALAGLGRRVTTSGGLLSQPITTVTVGRALVVRVPLAGSVTDPESYRALEDLRTDILPATFGKVSGIQYAVTGKTAIAYDFTAVLSGRIPIVFAAVLLMAFVLLAVSFRSIAIPIISIVLNLLSIGAAYGALTWIFQDGHLSSVFGFTSYGGVVSWLPMFLFVMLFGLSMDYHVFILSRVRERRESGMDLREAIVSGIGRSAGVVTSAAVIMTAVFGVFVMLNAIEYKMLGLSMAVAVLVDATLVRGVLLPAALALLPPRSWKPSRWTRPG